MGPQLIAGRGCRPPRGEGPDPGRPGRRSGGPTSLGGHPPRPAPRRAWGAHGVAASGVFHHDGRGRSGAGGGVLGGRVDVRERVDLGVRRATARSARSAASSRTVTRLRANSSPGVRPPSASSAATRRGRPDPVRGRERLAVAAGERQRHVAGERRRHRPDGRRVQEGHVRGADERPARRTPARRADGGEARRDALERAEPRRGGADDDDARGQPQSHFAPLRRASHPVSEVRRTRGCEVPGPWGRARPPPAR